MAALIAEEAIGSGLPIPLAPATAGDRSVTPELPAPPALRTVSWRKWPLRSAQGRLKDLHRRRRIPTTPEHAIPSPPSPPPGRPAPLRAFRLRLKTLRCAGLPGESLVTLRAGPDHSSPTMISKSDSPDFPSLFHSPTQIYPAFTIARLPFHVTSELFAHFTSLIIVPGVRVTAICPSLKI